MKNIQKRCVIDHYDYIKSYVQNQRNNKIQADYARGIERYKQIKSLLHDMTIHHPQLMSILLNTKSLTTKRPIDINEVNKIMYSYNKFKKNNIRLFQNNDNIDNIDNMIGGTFDKAKLDDIIKNTGELFNALNKTDLNKINTTTTNLIDDFEFINEQLEELKKNSPETADSITIKEKENKTE